MLKESLLIIKNTKNINYNIEFKFKIILIKLTFNLNSKNNII